MLYNSKYYQDLIDKEQLKFDKETSPSSKANYLNNIIRMKKSVYSKNSYTVYIYHDIKLWLSNYVKSFDENQYNYDIFSKDTVSQMISLVSEDRQMSLYYYLIRQLKMNSHTNDKISWCESKIKKLEIDELLKNCNVFNIFNLVFLFSSYNIFTLVITSIIYIGIVNILFLPEYYLGFKLFIIEYETYYPDNFILNHILNVTNYLFNFSNGDFKIIVNSFHGMLILVLLKIIFYLLIINFILVEMSRSLRKYE
jgi:hypothetical protein